MHDASLVSGAGCVGWMFRSESTQFFPRPCNKDCRANLTIINPGLYSSSGHESRHTTYRSSGAKTVSIPMFQAEGYTRQGQRPAEVVAMTPAHACFLSDSIAVVLLHFSSSAGHVRVPCGFADVAQLDGECHFGAVVSHERHGEREQERGRNDRQPYPHLQPCSSVAHHYRADRNHLGGIGA